MVYIPEIEQDRRIREFEELSAAIDAKLNKLLAQSDYFNEKLLAIEAKLDSQALWAGGAAKPWNEKAG